MAISLACSTQLSAVHKKVAMLLKKKYPPSQACRFLRLARIRTQHLVCSLKEKKPHAEIFQELGSSAGRGLFVSNSAGFASWLYLGGAGSLDSASLISAASNPSASSSLGGEAALRRGLSSTKTRI